MDVSLVTPMAFFVEWCVTHLFDKDMEKEVFDYYKDGITEHDILYYGFHKHNGKISIDTKRLKKVFEEEGREISDYFGVADLLGYPRNTHYFIPQRKKRYDYSVNYLVDTLSVLLNDWKKEYQPMIKTIKTPEQVEADAISSRIAFTSNMDDYDDILTIANIEKGFRAEKYNELIKSINVQYIQKISAEFLRMMFFVLEKHGYHNEMDLGGFADITRYVQRQFYDVYGKKNPIYRLKHYRYFLLVSLLSNFTKHNSLKAYLDLFNNSFERDPAVKKFLKSFVYGDNEHRYVNGAYAASWVNINSDKVVEIIDGLIEFSYEFCDLVFEESRYDSMWNYDDYLVKCIRNYIKENIDCDWDIF